MPFRGLPREASAQAMQRGTHASGARQPGRASRRTLRAILFDLDDTLFDHRHCAREALARVHGAHACFSATAFDAFVDAHAEHLETLHAEVVAGALDIGVARIERFRRLLRSAGGDPEHAAHAARLYRDAYVASRRAVRGAAETLSMLRARAAIVIVSNNLLAEQREKIHQCGLAPSIDALVVSEEAGVAKPDPAIFEIALRRAGAKAAEALMVGDSWAADIAGAHAAGILPVWFNPHGRPAPAAPAGVAQLGAFEPPHAAAATILAAFETHATRD